MPEPLISDETLGRVYDRVAAVYSSKSGWSEATGKRHALATLTRDLLRHYVSVVDLEPLTPYGLAAATVEAAVRLGHVSTPWDDLSEIAREQHLAFAGALIDEAQAEIDARRSATPLDQIQDT